MKFVNVRNDTGKRFPITEIRGLVFEPGEVKKVSPATVKHPAVSRHIGKGLTLVTSSQGEEPKAPIPTVKELLEVTVLSESLSLSVEEKPSPVEEVPLPVEDVPSPVEEVPLPVKETPPSIEKQQIPEEPMPEVVPTESPEPVEPVAEPMPVQEPPVMETPEKETAGNLQEAYLAAPGVTGENVQAILEAFPTFATLASTPVATIHSITGLTKTASRKLRDWAGSQV